MSNDTNTDGLSHRMLLSVGFVEGLGIMAVELASAKLVAPYYGTSLYVWSSVLGLTLLALTLGYWLGGALASRGAGLSAVRNALLVTSAAVLLMPAVAKPIMAGTLGLDLRAGIVLSLLLFLVPTLVVLASVGPLLIQLLSPDADDAGHRSGVLYAVSTAGGIMATYVYGFWLLPYLGVKASLVITAVLLVLTGIATARSISSAPPIAD
jgi:predicted membrane-bound spermidine synthase